MSTGWVVAVTRLAPDGAMVWELYDCAISHFKDAEEAVLKLQPPDDMTLLVVVVEPLLSSAVSSLGLQPGQIQKWT